MADPICRWRNPYYKTIKDLISYLPKEDTTSAQGRSKTNSNYGSEFFGTPYQTACQTGLYYEINEEFIVRFKHTPSPTEIKNYLRNWILNYYVPNPYTKKGFDGVKPKIIHLEFAKLLKNAGKGIDWNTAKLSVFEGPIGNDDILINSINAYSEILEIKNSKLSLKSDIEFKDLEHYIYDYSLAERDDKKAFFDFLGKDIENTDTPVSKSFEESDAKNIIYYGPPGTGKSFKIDKNIKDLDNKYFERITFHPEYDNSSFIGGYKPVSIKTKDSNKISYAFVPQAFTNIYVNAWKDQEKTHFLIIEEINRGNCAEIFGELFQLLDRDSNYTVSPSKELKEYLEEEAFKDSKHPGIKNGLKLPNNLSILATMNTSDQSLYPMDSAFKRRWQWQYTPICYTEKDESLNKNTSFNFKIDIQDGNLYSWLDFIKIINRLHIMSNSSLGSDKCIGNYFIKPDYKDTITLIPFINKVIFYLWNDVFKDEDNNVFENKTSYEDFFPINEKGTIKIKELFERIDLKPLISNQTDLDLGQTEMDIMASTT